MTYIGWPDSHYMLLPNEAAWSRPLVKSLLQTTTHQLLTYLVFLFCQRYPLPLRLRRCVCFQVELGRAEHISVVHVESAAAFFGQLMSVEEDAMYEMEEGMQNKYSSSVTPLKAATAGAFCVAKSAIDGTFYRAKVGENGDVLRWPTDSLGILHQSLAFRH